MEMWKLFANLRDETGDTNVISMIVLLALLLYLVWLFLR